MVCDEVVDDACQLVGGSGYRLGTTEAGALAAELAQGGWAAVEGLGRPAQRLGGAIGAGAGLGTDDLAAGDLVVGAQMQPGGEVPGIGKAREVRPEFGE